MPPSPYTVARHKKVKSLFNELYDEARKKAGRFCDVSYESIYREIADEVFLHPNTVRGIVKGYINLIPNEEPNTEA
jgi:hypothetical protein